MEPFPSSETSVLVYRFLLTNGCQDTATAYLKECPDLSGIRCNGGFGSQVHFLAGLPEVLYDYGKTRLIVKELTENLLTKWNALQEDIVTPMDSLTTQMRHISNLLRTIYSASPSPVGRRLASIIKTKRFASTCTSEDNMFPELPPKKLDSVSTQTELPVRSSTETQTEEVQVIVPEPPSQAQTQDSGIPIETQLYKSNTVFSGSQASVSVDMHSESHGAKAFASEHQPSQQNTPATPENPHQIVPYEIPNASTPQMDNLEQVDDGMQLTERERAKIQIAFMNTLLSNNEAQEKLANTCTRQISTGTGSQDTDELENGASAALTLSATASDVLECLLRDFDLMDGADSQDCNDVRLNVSLDPGNVGGNSMACAGNTGTVIPVIQENHNYSVTMPETEANAKEPSKPIEEVETQRPEEPENTDSLEPGEIRERPETPPVFIDIADSPQAHNRKEVEAEEEAKSPEQPKPATATLPLKKQKRKRCAELVQKRRTRPVPIQTQAFPEGLEVEINSRDCEIPVWNLLGRRGITPRIPNPSQTVSSPAFQPENNETADSDDTQSRIHRLETAEAVRNIPKFGDESNNSFHVGSPQIRTPAPESVATPVVTPVVTPVFTPVVSTSSSKKLDDAVMSSLFVSAEQFSQSHVSIAKPNVQERKSYSTPRKKNNHVRSLQFSTPPSVNKILHTINEEELNRSGLSQSQSFSRKRPSTGPGCQSKSKKRLEWTENVPEPSATPTEVRSVAVRRNSALDSPEQKDVEEEEEIVVVDGESPVAESAPEELVNLENPNVLEFNGVLYSAKMVNGQLMAFPMVPVPVPVSPEKIPANSQRIEAPSPAAHVEIPPNPPLTPTCKKTRGRDKAKAKSRASPKSLESYDDTIQRVLTSTFQSTKKSPAKPKESGKRKSKGQGSKVSPNPHPPIPKMRIRLPRKSGGHASIRHKPSPPPQLALSESGSESPLKRFTLVSVENVVLPPPPFPVETLSRILPTEIPAGHNTITLCQGEASQPLPEPSPPLPPESEAPSVEPPPPASPSVPPTPQTQAKSVTRKARSREPNDRALIPQESDQRLPSEPESQPTLSESSLPKPKTNESKTTPERPVSKSKSAEPKPNERPPRRSKSKETPPPPPKPKSTERPSSSPQSAGPATSTEPAPSTSQDSAKKNDRPPIPARDSRSTEKPKAKATKIYEKPKAKETLVPEKVKIRSNQTTEHHTKRSPLPIGTNTERSATASSSERRDPPQQGVIIQPTAKHSNLSSAESIQTPPPPTMPNSSETSKSSKPAKRQSNAGQVLEKPASVSPEVQEGPSTFANALASVSANPPEGSDTPIWNPPSARKNVVVLNPSRRGASDESCSAGSWPAPPTPRFLRRGEAVSDWDSLSSAAVGGAFEPINFSANLYSLMTPIKSTDAVPMTPGRGGGTDLACGRGNSFLETPNLDLRKRIHGAGPSPPETELNTPNPKLFYTNSEIRSAAVPVEFSEPASSAFVPGPAAQQLTFTPVTGTLPIASNPVRQRYAPRAAIRTGGSPVSSKDTNTVNTVKSTRNTANNPADLSCKINQPSVAAAVPRRPEFLKFKVGGREKNLTWSETESALTLLSIGDSVRMVPPSPVHMLPIDPAEAESIHIHSVTISKMHDKVKKMNIEKLLQRVHASPSGKQK